MAILIMHVKVDADPESQSAGEIAGLILSNMDPFPNPPFVWPSLVFAEWSDG